MATVLISGSVEDLALRRRWRSESRSVWRRGWALSPEAEAIPTRLDPRHLLHRRQQDRGGEVARAEHAQPDQSAGWCSPGRAADRAGGNQPAGCLEQLGASCRVGQQHAQERLAASCR